MGLHTTYTRQAGVHDLLIRLLDPITSVQGFTAVSLLDYPGLGPAASAPTSYTVMRISPGETKLSLAGWDCHQNMPAEHPRHGSRKLSSHALHWLRSNSDPMLGLSGDQLVISSYHLYGDQSCTVPHKTGLKAGTGCQKALAAESPSIRTATTQNRRSSEGFGC